MQNGELRADYLGKLEFYMAEAIKSATDGEAKKVSEAIVPMIPTMLNTMQDLITDCTSTPTTKMRCLEMMMSAWARCLRSDLRVQRAEVSRAKSVAKQAVAAAEKTKASAKSKQASLEIAREKRKIARQLRKAEATPTPAATPATPAAPVATRVFDIDAILEKMKEKDAMLEGLKK